MSSSSSDSKDANLNLLQSAVDTSFISDDMFSEGILIFYFSHHSYYFILRTFFCFHSGASSTAESIDITSLRKSQTPKSQRGIDLNVPISMQDFFYKKMSKKINNSIEFVEVSSKKSKKKKAIQDEIGCVRLLRDTDPIKAIDFLPEVVDRPFEDRKPELKRRIVEPDNYSDEEKLKLALIDSESIIQQTESWKPKKVKSNKLFKYREKNSILYAIEPENEFSALRKKNNWCESKIAKFPWKKQAKNL